MTITPDVSPLALKPSAVPCVPDAAVPWLSGTPPGRSISRRVATHRIKRAQVLAATRRRIASEGHRGVTLGMIAADCDTTVQTIFNLVGNKFELLRAAIGEHGASLNVAANRNESYPLLMLGFADAIWASTQRNPDYIKEAALIFENMCRSSGNLARAAGTALIETALSDIRDDLRSTFTVTSIAGMLSTLIASTMVEWAQDVLQSERLRVELINRVGLVLIGAVKPSKGAEIEAWLSSGTN